MDLVFSMGKYCIAMIKASRIKEISMIEAKAKVIKRGQRVKKNEIKMLNAKSHVLEETIQKGKVDPVIGGAD
jgi:hypothetical protein